MAIDNPNIVIETSDGPKTFRVTQVRPYNRDPDTPEKNDDPAQHSQHDPDPPIINNPMDKPRRGRPKGRKNKPKREVDEDYQPGAAYTTAFVSRKEEADFEKATKT